MAEQLPQLYDVAYTDAEGEVVATRYFNVMHKAGEAPVEREVAFRELGSELGATDYHVHLMRPKETRHLIRRVRREQLTREITSTVMEKTLRTDIEDITRLVMIMGRPDGAVKIAN